jgi:hypothetical protein
MLACATTPRLQLFPESRSDAAAALKISINALKRLCRKHGIERWPYRKLQSLDNLAAACRASKKSEREVQVGACALQSTAAAPACKRA